MNVKKIIGHTIGGIGLVGLGVSLGLPPALITSSRANEQEEIQRIPLRADYAQMTQRDIATSEAAIRERYSVYNHKASTWPLFGTFAFLPMLLGGYRIVERNQRD